ncbi:type VI secretion system membrane subunit TssM [Cupriavidus sp. WS]|uniref:type VI secretion system membrane subunit TssM n=1 Tax=Cupriavidus sp. WS TaxID=1312922 RepID=UPI0003769D59|nr:type VI secretion system membrane subunit TssM [Cupriavidus sp. WS]
MSYLKRFFRFLFSRQTLAFIAVALLSLAVWFVGPLLAFGQLHPLEDAGPRVTVIVLLLALLLFWLLGWPLSPVAAVALCVLLWHAGPLFGLAEHHPLAPVWVRVLLISVIVFCYSAYGLYRLWHAVRANPDLLKRILNPSSDKADPVARDEIRTVSLVVAKAVGQLKRLRGGTLRTRVLERGRHLYELPWYLMLGTPGAGKTSAILGSGLEFPLADQMGAQSAPRGARGTANCDWWFANEAVLIDTAGRYVQHESRSDAQVEQARQAEQAEQAGDEERGEQGQQDRPAAAVNAAEWRGFLGLLRKHRPRAPVNGAILAISAAELLDKSDGERTALAASLRARLGELRNQLGIRFPVYVLVTKLDLLPGFPEYFQSLSAEGRAQAWGFTLPHGGDGASAEVADLRRHCADELAQLEARIDAGLNNRLLEEYDNDRRKTLYALPREFRSLCAVLVDTLGLVFLDSRYDDTQLQTTMRGVYFTSTEQTGQVVPADRETLMQRLRRRLARLRPDDGAAEAARADAAPPVHRGYFLRDVFRQVIVPEAHLVRPNLKWEIRLCMVRWAGHLLVATLFLWLVSALTVSFDNNRAYLTVISQKTGELAAGVKAYNKAPQAGAIAGMLDASRDLPQYRSLDLLAPGGAYRYGLYTAPVIVDASRTTYSSLLHQALFPQVVRRVEAVLGAQVDAGNADEVYRTLMAYLMLYDDKRFDAQTVGNWVLRDWERTDGATAMGGREAMSQHLDAMFAARPARPGVPQDAALVQRARSFLSSNPAPRRLYERAMASMEKEAPENFTLARAAGIQGASIFVLADGTRYERGVPGLYTYDGYHEVFGKRLPEFLARAQSDDAWVMGRAEAAAAPLGGLRNTSLVAGRSAVADDIRRQYLTDYGNHWQQFLADVRPAAAGAQSVGGTLALDLNTLRVLASPDSPLVRLARAAVRETSLSLAGREEDSSLADMALAAVGRKSGTAQAAATTAARIAAQRPEQRLEKELVDNRFAALREVVTGQADTGSGPAMSNPPVSGSKALQLDALIALLNEQYTRLAVADNALASSSMPPALDIGTTLQMEADKLPAPLRLVLGGIASQSASKVGREVGALLALQMDSSVGASCRLAIEGKYPFAASSQEVDIEDFNRVFAAGGLLDDFFQKSFASYVDTNVRPWRYKALNPGMPPIQGPSLEPFERAAAIRELFFREPGAKRMAWKMDARIAAIDPEITELAVDVDGQGLRYAHGPVRPFALSWPGPRGGAVAEITAKPRIRPDTSTIVASGPWALFRLIERGRLSGTASASRLVVDFDFDGRHAALELVTGGQFNPLATNLLKDFRCPGTTAGRGPGGARKMAAARPAGAGLPAVH